MYITRVEAELANYYSDYPDDKYLELPEFIIEKMGMNPNLLQELPYERNKNDIYNWMKRRNFTYEELIWIGW